MDGFLRRKLAQTSGNILGGSSLQKPVSSYQIKLPELSSSICLIADEQFPEVSGLLDDTVSPSFISKEASLLNAPPCAHSKSRTKNKDKGVTSESSLNYSFGVCSQSAGGSTSTKSLQNDKDNISITAGKTDASTETSFQSSTFLEKSDLMSIDLKNSTFGVTRDLKESSDPVVNSTADLQKLKEKNSTVDLTQDLKEWPGSGSNSTVDLQHVKEKNSTFDLTQELKKTKTVDLQIFKEKNNTIDLSQESKKTPDVCINVNVHLKNIKENNGTFDLTHDLREHSNTETNVNVDLKNIEEKNGTFNLTQDLKEHSNTETNATVDLKNIKENNGTFNLTQDLKEHSNTETNATVDLQKLKENNSTSDLSQNLSKMSDSSIHANVDLQNLKGKNSTFDLNQDSKEQSDTSSNATGDLQNINEKDGTFDVGLDSKEKSDMVVNASVNLHKIKEKNCTFASQEPNPRITSTVDIDVHNIKTESGNATVDLVWSQDHKEGPDTRVNATVDIPNVESVGSNADLPVVNSAPVNSTTEQPKENLEGIVDIQQQEKLDGSLNSEDDKIKNAEETNLKINVTVEEEQMGSAPLQQSGDISRNSIFCLDDTLHMRTSFMFTSTPIVFGKESRFEILRDTKPTPMRRRLSVINSIEVQSNDELVGASNHEGTSVQATEGSGQKVSANCTSSHSTAEPTNENKPPTKPPIKRRLPQLSSKFGYSKSSLPPRPQASIDSSAAVKTKIVRGPQTLHPPTTLTTPQLGVKKTIQMKGKSIAPVKNTVPASTVKTSMVSSVTGYNFTAVAKPSSSGIPQVKPSGLQPPTRKRLALKTPQTTQPPAEAIQTQLNNKPTALPGMRTRNSQPPSVGQKHLSNDGLPSAKRKRIAPAAQCTAESDAAHPVEGDHESDCVNCLQHQEKLDRVLQELKVLRSECKNWGPLHEKLEMCVEEMKRL